MLLFRGLFAHRGPQFLRDAVIGFAAQAKPVRFESAGASTLHTLEASLLVLIRVTQGERKI